MASSKLISDDVLAVLDKAVEKGIYGSIEFYFEKGKITQITERVIKKIRNETSAEHSHRISSPQKKS